jgi:hypothetical protein
MVTKTFRVTKYQMALGHAMTATWGGHQIKARGYVACSGTDHRLIVYFLTDDSPVPPPMYVVANKVGALFFPFKEIGPFVDMVRNEKPIYAYLNSDKPEWISLKTGKEPVGEEET